MKERKKGTDRRMDRQTDRKKAMIKEIKKKGCSAFCVNEEPFSQLPVFMGFPAS